MKHLIPIATIFATLAISCTRSGSFQQKIHEEKNSVYYWKTVFNLSKADLSFIERHNIGRIYLRLFDVVPENTYAITENDKTVPNASVSINEQNYYLLKNSLTEKEFVPVVYITLDALKAMSSHEGVLASNIVERVRNMCQYNALPNVHELQLDCDWTVSTETAFFAFCDSVKLKIASLQLPWRLSATIRLHQLAQKVPPVDNGVLMIYNTGSFNNPDAVNSIIDAKDVEPYLKHLSDYPLHLDVAYPTYSWQLLFRKRLFIGLLKNVNLTDSALFTRKENNVYVARKDIPYSNRIIRAGDMVREEISAFKELARVKSLIEQRLGHRRHSHILYHLDPNNLSTYKPDEIDHLLSPDNR